MVQSFSFKRSLLLFKLIFINNVNNPVFKRMLMMSIIATVLFSVGSILGVVNLINSLSVPISFVITATLGAILSLHGYEQYRDKLNICTSHMLPASVNEKFFVPLFTSVVLIVGMLSIVYVIWSLLQLVIGGGGAFDIIITNILSEFSIIALFVFLLLSLSICCLFSVLFKNGASAGFMIIMLVYQLIQINVLMSKYGSDHMSPLSSLSASAWYCSMIILSLLFWYAAYTIFRKRQLNK